MIYKDNIELIELPKIIELSSNIHVLKFELMKLLPARYIIEKSLNSGLLTKEMTVIESSSGSFALGLAYVCAKHHLRLIIVGDPAIDKNLKNKLEILGAEVEIVEPSQKFGVQKARLRKLREIREKIGNTFWPQQYDNPLNPESYFLVGNHIIQNIDKIDCLVGSVGSGGSVCGIANYFDSIGRRINVVGVDTHGSVLFGQKSGTRYLRGLGNGILPKNVNHTLFDQIHWVNAPDSYNMCNELYKRNCLFMGGTSGASYLVGKWWAKKNPSQNVLIIFPDSGERYVETIYNKIWLEDNGMLKEEIKDPLLVLNPDECNNNHWAYMEWNRRNISSLTAKNAYNYGHQA